MLQFSVYSKILNTREAARDQIKAIELEAPSEGNVRLLLLTEKQYANMRIIVGGKSFEEDKLTVDPFIMF